LKTPPAIKAEGLTVSSNALFLYGLEMEKSGTYNQWSTLWASSLNGKLQSPKRIYTRMEWRAQITKGFRDETYPLGVRFKIYWTKTQDSLIGREATSKDTKIVAAVDQR
jgi:hypothetical protein